MPTDPLDIQAAALVGIQQATDRLLTGGSVEVWADEMQAALARGHTAALLTGVAERGAGGRVRQFLSRFVGERALSREDRDRLRALLRTQLDYLSGFIADVQAGRLSPEQIRARATLYAGATRGTYSEARWSNVSLPFHPTQGSECGANCRCSWEVVELAGRGNADAYWRLGAVETVHCTTCPSRAAASPYRLRGGSMR